MENNNFNINDDLTSRDIPACVGPNILRMRKAHRLSLANLSAMVGYSASYINRVEKSERRHVSHALLVNISQALGTNLRTLLKDDSHDNVKHEAKRAKKIDALSTPAEVASQPAEIDKSAQKQFIFNALKGICENAILSDLEKIQHLKILADISHYLLMSADDQYNH